MVDEQYWGEERRHCNRMISAIFFGSLSSAAIIVEFLNSIPVVTILILSLIFGGSTIWILMYARWRVEAIENDGNIEDGGMWWWSPWKVAIFPGFYLILALLMGILAFSG